MTDLHQQIADLEADIDALSDVAERCRKSMIIAKVAVIGGVMMFGATIFGLISSGPIALLVGIAAPLVGIAFFGSSRSTREQVAGKIRLCEARRAELIDHMDLSIVQAQ